MRFAYLVSADEMESIKAKLNDIIFRLSKLEKESYQIRHALSSAKEIEEILEEEESVYEPNRFHSP